MKKPSTQPKERHMGSQLREKSNQLSAIVKTITAWTSWWEKPESPFMHNSQSILVILTTTGDIAHLNKHTADLLKYHQDFLVGKNFFETLLPLPQRDKIRQEISQTFQQKESFAGLFPIVTGSGEMLHIQWSLQMLLDARGLPAGYAAFGQNVSEVVNLQQRMQQYTAWLEVTQELQKASQQSISSAEIAQLTAEKLKKQLDCHSVTVVLLHENQAEVQILARASDEPLLSFPVQQCIFDDLKTGETALFSVRNISYRSP
jgi:PAS domain S-box-containing protein